VDKVNTFKYWSSHEEPVAALLCKIGRKIAVVTCGAVSQMLKRGAGSIHTNY